MTVVPGRQRGGHQRVLGRHHRRLVHEHVGRPQAARGAQHDLAVAVGHRRPSRGTRRGADRGGGGRSRRRPGGGITARPKRASSGPASRNEARIGSASSRSIATSCTSAAHSATSFGPRQLTLDADRREDLEHRLDVADARDVAHDDLVLGEDAGGEDRQRAVLVAGRHHRAGQRDAAFDDELLHELSAPPAGHRGPADPLVERLASVTAMSPGVRVRARGPCFCLGERGRTRAPAGRICNFCCSRIMPWIRLCRAKCRVPSAIRTDVRVVAVRRRSYLTNTCSPPPRHRSLRSARSVPYAWPARSCCSRTTTRSTGRSARSSAPVYRIRIERRCAEGAPRAVPASCRHGRRRACRPWGVARRRIGGHVCGGRSRAGRARDSGASRASRTPEH